MSDSGTDDWSPADNPHSIALTEAQWWQRAAELAILRLRDDADMRISWFSSHQIDARFLVIALRQILTAEHLQQEALVFFEVSGAVGMTLTKAREKFEAALPGIKDMRDGLVHFEDWSRGQGGGPQKARRKAGESERDIAMVYSGFGYNPGDGTISNGPFSIDIDTAERESADLASAIYLAGCAIDASRTV